MNRFKLTAFMLAGALALGAVAACAEPPADTSSDDNGAEQAEQTTEDKATTEPVAGAETEVSEGPDMPEGCMASMQEVMDVLSLEVADKGGTAGTAAKAPLEDISEMIYGAWELNAVEVTNADGEQEVAVWATKVLPPGEWSSAAGEGATLAYAVNDVAAGLSDYDMATKDVLGREVTMDDPAVTKAMDCLAMADSGN